MAIFNSYVKLPEGIRSYQQQLELAWFVAQLVRTLYRSVSQESVSRQETGPAPEGFQALTMVNLHLVKLNKGLILPKPRLPASCFLVTIAWVSWNKILLAMFHQPEQDENFVGTAVTSDSSPSEIEVGQGHWSGWNRRQSLEVLPPRHQRRCWSHKRATPALWRRSKLMGKQNLSESLQSFWSVNSIAVTCSTQHFPHCVLPDLPVEVARHSDPVLLLTKGEPPSKKTLLPGPRDLRDLQTSRMEQIRLLLWQGSASGGSQGRNCTWNCCGKSLPDPFWLHWGPWGAWRTRSAAAVSQWSCAAGLDSVASDSWWQSPWSTAAFGSLRAGRSPRMGHPSVPRF